MPPPRSLPLDPGPLLSGVAPPESPGGPEGSPPPDLLSVELSLATGGLEELEAASLALSPERLNARFESTEELRELAVLRTCHRLEILAWGRDAPAVRAAVGELLPASASVRWRAGEEAVEHLFRVAAGLESMAVGEREVREQVRAASSRVRSRSPRPVLRPLLLGAARAADLAAPAVPASRSIAAIAAARVLEESPRPFPRILVIGSGTVGREVAEMLAPSGRLTLLYRTRPPEEGFLRAVGARAAPWGALAEEVRLADVVVTAAKSGERLLGPGSLDGRTGPVLLVDLGVPRNIDPALDGRPGVCRLDLEGLRPATRPGAATGLEAEVRRRAGEAAAGLRAVVLEEWVTAFRRAVEATRREVLNEARPFLGPLTPEQEAAVERLTRRLASQLLRSPTDGLRALPTGPDGEALRRWALAWLTPAPRRS